MGSEECGSNSRGEKINPQVCIEKSKFPKGRPEVQPQILRLRLAQSARQSALRMTELGAGWTTRASRPEGRGLD